MTLKRATGLVVAVLMMAVGVLWTGQGLGWFGGSSMSGDGTWAIVGPLVAGLGVALAITIVGHVRRERGAAPSELDKRYGGRRP